MKLYELAGALAQLREAMYGEEDAGDEAVRAVFDSIEGALEAKVEGCAKVLKQLQADADVIREEEVRLAARRKSIENNRERLRGYIRDNMKLAGEAKIKTPLFTIWLAGGKDKLVVDEDVVPKEYQVATWSPDKKAIRAALERGEVIEGARLEPGEDVLNVR